MPADRKFLLAFVTLALLYAFLAGLRTTGDPDLGWQLATGRHVVRTGDIPAGDVLSYTAAGKPWLYGPLSAPLFYALFQLGGFELISWFSALATVAIVGLLLLAGSTPSERLATAVMGVLAVPVIAFRTRPRADMFTTVLFAALLVVLWRYFRGKRSPIWCVPLITCAWANLHPGFASGLALVGIYVALELTEIAFPSRREPAMRRLRSAGPWLALAFPATLVNPFGAGVYRMIRDWNGMLKELEGHIGDWFTLPVTRLTLLEALDWRNPDGAYWWMLLLGVVAAVLFAWRKLPGPVLLMAFFAFGSLRFLRFQALLAMVSVVMSGYALACLVKWPAMSARARATVLAVLLTLVGGLVGLRISDLVSNRYYLAQPDTVLFGAGGSWAYPSRASEFVLRNHLPGRILNDFNTGGYLTWHLGPYYPVALDGRCVPFGSELIFRNKALFASRPDSELWRKEADHWAFNTVIVPVHRYSGTPGTFVRQLCESREWRPVYLDEVAGVFVRNRPENRRLLDELSTDCFTTELRPPPEITTRSDLYNFYANAGLLLSSLGRREEAFESLERARRLFDGDPQLYLIRGGVLLADGRAVDAEKDFRHSLQLREGDQGWYALGQALIAQRRYQEAADATGKAARYSSFPHEYYRLLGALYLALSQPDLALRAYEDAAARDVYKGGAATLGRAFHTELAAGRAAAWRNLGDLDKALGFQRQAVEYSPSDPRSWIELAEMYRAKGRLDEARQAERQAESLRQ